ncbi:MAG: CapA family protein [Lachnospiraceae bacterium]|nr:CapA family protein [Lachnospiraceae bacterium]
MKKVFTLGVPAVILIAFVIVYSWGCQADPIATEDVWNTIKADSNEGGAVVQDVAEIPLDEVYDASEMILDHATAEFFGHYAIDDSFLSWIYSNYGAATLIALAEESQKEKPDAEAWYELTGSSIHVLWLEYNQELGLRQDELALVHWKDCASEDEVVLDFTGDINFSEGWETTEYMDAQSGGIYDCFSMNLLQEMNDADILMVNNEFTYSTRGTALEGKAYTFRADPSRVSLLNVFGTDLVGIANNHMYDYGPEALVDSLDILDHAGMPHTGAGRNISQAEQPVYFIANGRKIAIIAATQIERTYNYTKEATETEPGVLKTLNAARYVAAIERVRENSDYVIAFVHWGTEGTHQYGADQVNLAKQFVAAGADVIIGGHTHCLQGIQYMDGVPIIYSLGNFWFSSETLDTGIAQVRIQEDGTIRFRFIPCLQQEYKTSLVTDATEKQRVLDFMESISTDVSYDADGYVIDMSQ